MLCTNEQQKGNKMSIRVNCVKTLLSEANLSQTELADQLGADRVNLNKIINNKRGLDHDLAKKIAKILNVHWFQIYEPMNLEMPIMGTIDKDYKIDMHTMAENKIEMVTLFHYLADLEHLISLKSTYTHALWLIDKRFKSDKLQWHGYHYGKKNNGSLFMSMNTTNGLMELTRDKHISEKKISMKNVEYLMPVSRVDFDYKYSDPALEQKYSYNGVMKTREPKFKVK